MKINTRKQKPFGWRLTVASEPGAVTLPGSQKMSQSKGSSKASQTPAEIFLHEAVRRRGIFFKTS